MNYSSGCGHRRPGYDMLPVRRFEFILMWGIKVFFSYAPRRVNCSRWLLLKRPENLKAKQEPKLAGLLRFNLNAVRSYLLEKVERQLRRHRPLLLNWFRENGQFSSGIVGGFNNKAKLTTRKAYGFRTYHATEIALYYALRALPIRKPPMNLSTEACFLVIRSRRHVPRPAFFNSRLNMI